jgi:hypothetical protein
MNKFLTKYFLSNFIIVFLFNAFVNGNAYSAAINGPVDVIEAELKKLAISETISPPPAPVFPKFEVNLERHLDDTATPGTKKIAARYFSKTASLRCEGVAMTGPEAKENFATETANHLDDVEHFLQTQVGYNKKGWRNNHLTASLYVIVYDRREEKVRQIAGSLLVQKMERETKSGELPSPFYDFSVLPGNKGLGSDRRKVNFSSKEVFAETPFSKEIDLRGYLSISKDQLRPITEVNNHGDQLALDTIITNSDLFFSLIRRTAHRHDLSIMGMGVRYCSSYDACDACFRKIYDARGYISKTLTGIASVHGYSIRPTPLSNSKEIPFYSLFYSSRPYTGGESTSPASYALSWTDPRDRLFYTHSPYPVTYEFDWGKPVYNPFAINFPSKYMEPFTASPDKRLSLLEGPHAMKDNYVYSYVEHFSTNYKTAPSS